MKKVLLLSLLCISQGSQSSQIGDVNAKDSEGKTQLHRLATRYTRFPGEARASAAQALIDAGADVNARDNDQNTPLHEAAYDWRGNMKEFIEALIKNGADINAQDKNGFTPLHKAAYKGNEDVYSLLIQLGANPDIKDNNGKKASDYLRGARERESEQKQAGEKSRAAAGQGSRAAEEKTLASEKELEQAIIMSIQQKLYKKTDECGVCLRTAEEIPGEINFTECCQQVLCQTCAAQIQRGRNIENKCPYCRVGPLEIIKATTQPKD